LGLLLLASQTACVSSKSWKEDQYLLHNLSVKGNETVPTYELEELYQQKPNRTVGIFLPYLWVYNIGEYFFRPEKIKAKIENTRSEYAPKIRTAELKNKENKVRRLEKKERKKITKLNRKLKEGNWFMRSVGEAPVFYDSVRIQRTAEEMKKYLQNKGFFQGQVRIDTQRVYQKRIKATFNIIENRPTFFGNVTYFSNNFRLDSILEANQTTSIIIKDASYNTDKISAEQQRIERLLQNNGYFYFSRQYVNFNVDTLHFGLPSIDSLRKVLPDSLKEASLSELTQDTTLVKLMDSYRKYDDFERKANIRAVINNPKEGKHNFYRIEDIYFHITSSNGQKSLATNTTAKEVLDTIVSPVTGIHYVYDTKELNYKYRVLDRRMRLRPNQIYKQEDVLNTQNSIGVLDVFKFVNFNPDSVQNGLRFNVYTQPMERFQISDEIGLDGIQGLPGPFVNVSLRNRNTFKGSELFENSLRLAIDGQTSFSNQGSFSSQELAFSSSLTFPRVLFPYKFLPRGLKNVVDLYNPTTKLSLTYNYVRRPEYTRTNLSGAISYKVQTRKSTYNLTLADLSVVNTQSISQSFQEQLAILTSQGNTIIQSFNRALVSSISFAYTYNNNYGNTNVKSSYLRILLESGGTTLNLLRKTSLIENNRIFGLRVFQYWRINPTFYYYLPLKKPENALAFRVNVGVAKAYGASSTLPYEKFFFAGGSNGMRAWITRRLGPGASRPEVREDGTFDYRFEAPGEIIFEGNVEYRFPLFGFVKGAFFVDVGNVWNIQEQDNQPEGKFKFGSFYKQIAIGSGFGARLNLSFLLLRLDLGIKVYDPARISDRRWVIREFNPLKPIESRLLRLNLGIGYPF
jgi:outer membrane protein assembly factor BamA